MTETNNNSNVTKEENVLIKDEALKEKSRSSNQARAVVVADGWRRGKIKMAEKE